MNKKKWIKLGLTVLLAFSLTACGTKDSGNADQSNSAVTMTAEAENAQEALSTYKKLMDQENEILSENTDLWEKVYMEADKGSAMLENGKNYGDFLLDTIENVKDQFSDEEYELLKTSAEKISEIENKLTELEQKYPEIVEQSMDSETSIPGDSAQAGSSEDSSVQKFPAFEGKDLDGNQECSNRGEFLVYHLQSLRRRAWGAGCAEQRACREKRRTHRCELLYAGWE